MIYIQKHLKTAPNLTKEFEFSLKFKSIKLDADILVFDKGVLIDHKIILINQDEFYIIHIHQNLTDLIMKNILKIKIVKFIE